MNKCLDIRKLMKTTDKGKIMRVEKTVPRVLLVIASISIFTTLGIIVTLLIDSSHFFRAVPLKEIFSTELAPLRHHNPSYGILPLIMGTAVTSIIAMFVAIPIGLSSCYVSQ
jgi:phosphate transport system permease protein